MPALGGRRLGGTALLARRVGFLGQTLLICRLVSNASDRDRRERDPELAEHLGRDEEPCEQEQDRDELANLEPFRDPEAGEDVSATGRERADGDQDRRRDAGVEAAGEERAGSETTKFTGIATIEMIRLKRNSSPGWFGSSE
jgi:hypothetical protein